MARNWQYPRWRRVALQVVMCVILAASVGLAAYIQHRRQPPPVTLGEPELRGRLIYRLPVGWRTSIGGLLGPGPALLAREPGKRKRQILVAQGPARDRSAEEWLATVLGSPLPLPGAEPIEIAGETGVMVTVHTLDERESGLYAAAVMPEGWAVILVVRGDASFGPSGRDLLRQMARSMERASQALPPEVEPVE